MTRTRNSAGGSGESRADGETRAGGGCEDLNRAAAAGGSDWSPPAGWYRGQPETSGSDWCWTLVSVVLIGCLLLPLAALAQDAATADQKSEPDARPVFPELRQPGDDDLFELRDESGRIDPRNKDALAWYMAGLLAQKRGELKQAAEAFERAAQAAPQSAPPLKALALVLLRLGRIPDGMKKAAEAIELDPDDYETRLQLALIFASGNKPLEATEMINAALKSQSLNRKTREFVTLHQVRARLLLAQQQFAAAADSYEVIFEALERPEDFGLSFRDHQALLKDRASGYAMTGTVLLEAGRTEQAIRVFEALNRVESDRPGDHHLLLARALFLQDKLPECEKNLDTYFRTGRRDQGSLTLLQDLYNATSRSGGLIDRLNELSVDVADSGRVRMFVGQILLDQGRTDEAAVVYQKLLDEKGEADAYIGLMRVQIARQDPAGLMETMNRAVRSRIQVEEFLPLAPSVVIHEEFARKLVTACETAWKESPNELNAAVTCFCAEVAGQLEALESEGVLLQATLELNPDRNLAVRVLDRYGMNLLLQNKHAQAARAFAQLTVVPGLLPGQRLMALYRLSQAESFNENYPAALEAIQTAISLGPDIPLLHYQLGWVLVQSEAWEEAEKKLRMVLDQFADDRENSLRTRLLLAGLFAQQSRWNEAISEYQLIVQSEGVDAETKRRCQLGLSNAYVQNGDMASGEKVLEEIYQQSPDDVGVNNDLGYLYADQNKNLEQAEKMIRVAVAAQPDNPAYLDSLGWVLFRLGRLEEAVVELKKASSDPAYRDATILEHLGDVYAAMQQLDEAKATWREALKTEQDSKRRDVAIISRLEGKLGEPSLPEAPEAPEPQP